MRAILAVKPEGEFISPSADAPGEHHWQIARSKVESGEDGPRHSRPDRSQRLVILATLASSTRRQTKVWQRFFESCEKGEESSKKCRGRCETDVWKKCRGDFGMLSVKCLSAASCGEVFCLGWHAHGSAWACFCRSPRLTPTPSCGRGAQRRLMAFYPRRFTQIARSSQAQKPAAEYIAIAGSFAASTASTSRSH
jgi:hypothetical protein